MEFIQGISVPLISIIVYWIINLAKYALHYNVKFKRFIPLIAMSLGSIIGGVIFYLQPALLSANGIISAIILGGASGLSASGTHEIVKQLSKSK